MLSSFFHRSWFLFVFILSCGGCSTREASLCGSLPGTAEEIAATPRQDENLELLALRLSNGLTAKEPIYQRLVRDIAAIRAQEPAVRTVTYFAPYRQSLNIGLDESNTKELQEGKYRAWDCLNEHFGVAEISGSGTDLITLTFKGRFDVERLAEIYKVVTGVKFAEPVRPLGDASTIFVTLDADTWHYVFDKASGDCARGCTEHEAYYFAVGDDGSPRFLGRWNSASPVDEAPSWVERYWQGTKLKWRTPANS